MLVNSARAEVKVKSQRGKYVFGHKVGDKIVFDGRSVKGDVCYSALMVLLLKVYAMIYDASFPWAKEKDAICNASPDGENPVVSRFEEFEKRLRAGNK